MQGIPRYVCKPSDVYSLACISNEQFDMNNLFAPNAHITTRYTNSLVFCVHTSSMWLVFCTPLLRKVYLTFGFCETRCYSPQVPGRWRTATRSWPKSDNCEGLNAVWKRVLAESLVKCTHFGCKYGDWTPTTCHLVCVYTWHGGLQSLITGTGAVLGWSGNA